MSATHEQIRAILSSNAWTESEKWVVMWQFRLLGDFETALAAAITRADTYNLIRLEQGFPDQVRGYRAWAFNEPYNLAEKLRDAGLDT